MITLANNYKLFIPTEFDESIRKAQADMAEYYGGTTSYQAFGGWVSPSGEFIEEPITVIQSNAMEGKDALKVYDLAAQVLKDCNQEAVSVEINGVLHIIDGETEDMTS